MLCTTLFRNIEKKKGGALAVAVNAVSLPTVIMSRKTFEQKGAMAEIIVDETADVPIWIQIRNRVIYLIRSGQLQPGDRLPSVRELAVKQNINFNTAAKAYKDLERDGLIQTKRGSGTFVTTQADAIKGVSDSPLDALIGELLVLARSSGISNDELLFRIRQQIEPKDDIHG